ncbi:hypothetical protein HHI36_005842 [Cryptolaemus montrouzieri]|uniref:Retrotransposon gag domain-containing protein n=1 Tax=Cryptolaemus montrouzieri TaxID=559131 RepID=A0ABD2NVC8_9CUCU
MFKLATEKVKLDDVKYKFLTCNQEEGQLLSQYILELKSVAATCEHATTDKFVRNKLIMGLLDNQIQLLQMVDFTLKKAKEMCPINEESRKQTVKIGGRKEAEVSLDSIGQTKQSCFKKKSSTKNFLNNNNSKSNKCLYTLQEEQQNSSDDSEEFLLNSISLEIMDAELTNNVLPAKMFEDLSEIDAGRKHEMQTANVNLIAYGGTKTGVVGSTQLNCIIRNKEVTITFSIVNTGDKPEPGSGCFYILYFFTTIPIAFSDTPLLFG